jgi:CheY-like chemotaxis protein
MNCPRCKATIGPLANPDGVVTCLGCGSRLMTRSAMLRSQSGPKASGPAPAPGKDPLAGKSPRDLPPEATLPPTPAMMLGLTAHADTRADEPPPSHEAPATPKPAAAPPSSPAPPASGRKTGTPKRAVTPPSAAASAPDASPAPPASSSQETLDLVLRELRAVRDLQERILDLLARSPAAERASSDGDDEAAVSPIRVRRRKSVVLIDDDPITREAAVAELTQADVPVRAYPNGNAAVSAIAEEKPDVIVLELTLAGEMEGRDVINMIKATMEWVDIPIVLWTREQVQNQREARLVHGADEIVLKSSGASALVARVITLFRRVH